MLPRPAAVLQPRYIDSRAGGGRRGNVDNRGEGMAETFEELGVAEALATAAGAAGWDRPTGLQADAVPVLRRGSNVVLRASPGAGAVGAYGLGVLDRVSAAEPAVGPAALVIVPDADSASLTARSLARLAAPAGIAVRALAPGWVDRPARVLVAAAPAAVAAIRDSSLKLTSLLALVLDGADRALSLDVWADIETIAEAAPSDTQRVVVTGTTPAPIEDFVERHARRAMTFPPRPVEETAAPSTGVTVRYAVATEHDKIDALVDLLAGLEGDEVAVVVRTRAAAQRVAAELAERGLVVDGAGDRTDPRSGTANDAAGPRVLVLPTLESDRRSTRADVVSLDVPFDADGMADLHRRGGAVVVTPREVPHLRRITERAGFELQAVPAAGGAAPDPVERLRQRLRDRLHRGDLAAELALIEPLLAGHSAAEVAAAALALARERAAPASAAAPAPERRAAVGGQAGRAAAPPPSTSWTRLFLTVGERDGVGPGDVVGVITGEAGVEGGLVGRIDIRESHTTVEVAASVAERVIGALNGRTLRGRSLRVDYDRKDRPGTRGPAGRSGSDRSTRRSGGGKGGRTGPRRSGPDR